MIGVFDSGVGGLTVLRALKAALPQHHFLYLADFGYCPYGNRSASDILQRSISIVQWMKKLGVRLVVVACHTSSSVLTTEMILDAGIPMITMLEPTLEGILDHPHRRDWKNGIAILATALTIKKGALVSALSSKGFDLPIYPLACPPLAGLIEARDYEKAMTYMDSYVFPFFKNHPIDMMVYGCTHYPCIEPWLGTSVVPEIIRMDPAKNVAISVSAALGLLSADTAGGQEAHNPNLALSDTPSDRVWFYHTGASEKDHQRLSDHWPHLNSSTPVILD